ncbi:MAG: PepSY domain-containing protein [Nitrospira sp.]|nr:PepSY domain-containing protein [Nitrospira sp.]
MIASLRKETAMHTSRLYVTMFTVLIGSSLLLAGPAWSDKKGKSEEEGNVADMVKGATVTADQAIRTATEKVPGTVVEVELEKKHDKTIWEVEVVGADGKISEVHIDAATGAVIDVEAKKDEKKSKGKK